MMDLDRFELWLYSEQYSQLTVRKYVNLLKSISDDLDIDSTEDLEIARYLYELRVSRAAKNNRIKAINLYLKYLERTFRLKQLRDKGTMDFWIPTPEEKERLLSVVLNSKYATARAQLILEVLFESGIRAAELCNLKMADVKTKVITRDKKQYRVYYLDVYGKGGKWRQVPVSFALVEKIRRYYAYYGKDPYVFGIATSTLRKIMSDVRQKTGIKIHAHAARHYRAVELYQQGVDLETIRKFLGHSDISTTQIYLQGSKGDIFFEILKLQESGNDEK